MRSCNSGLLMVIILLSFAACAVHFGGGQIDTQALYTARSFLVQTQPEGAGYGLYSYLLLPAPPRAETELRYEEAVRAFLTHPPASISESMLPRDSLNIFYLMLDESPPKKINRCLMSNCHPVDHETVQWILSHYSYARAQIVMQRASVARHEGPFIATFRQPVTLASALPEKPLSLRGLLQDLSTVPPHLVRAWVRVFIDEATGKGSAFERDLKALMLYLRTALDTYASGLPAVIDACKQCMLLTN